MTEKEYMPITGTDLDPNDEWALEREWEKEAIEQASKEPDAEETEEK